MKRAAFIAALFGVIRTQAQTPLGTNSEGWLKPWQQYKPKNNQCPVCGTMSTPFNRRKRLEELKADPLCNCNQMKPEELPESRMVRCRQCSAAFWQDADDKGRL